MKSSSKGAAVLTAMVAASLAMTACGSSSSSGKSTSSSTGTSASSGSTGGAMISTTDLNSTFSAMTSLKSLAAEGKGKIAAILPDTTTSARYTEFDAPYLMKAASMAGISSSDMIVQNAQGSDATQYADAQADITNGADVIILDGLDDGVGAKIESYAKSKGAVVIDYDRMTTGGSRQYYVSFNNVQVGTLIGNGLVSCVANWKVKSPNVIDMTGSPTDPNAAQFAQGYNAVLNPLFKGGTWKLAASPAGTWDPPTAATEFEQAYTAHPGANALLSPNDENAAPIITYLKSHGIKPDTFPVTGQDATLVGLQNIISGYQCGTVYKAINQEAQAAVAVAIYARASKTPPSSLLNGTNKDLKTGQEVPSVLLTPEWVTPSTISSTVIKDGAITASQLCSGSYAADCTKYGISG